MKRIKRIMAAVLIVLVISGLSVQPHCHRETQYLLDTMLSFTVYGRGAQEATRAAIARVEEIDRKMSAYRSDSEITKINTAPCRTEIAVSEDTYALLARAVAFSEETDGLFDCTLKPLSDLWGIGTEHARVPSEEEIREALSKTGWQSVRLSEENHSVCLEKEDMGLDLGGIAKGYAAEEAARVLKENGIQNACLDFGGNVVILGEKPLGVWESITNGKRTKPFVVGIQKPDAPRGEAFTQFAMQEGCVVTSGDYERYFEQDGKRYHHIFDPRTGRPAESGLGSATVIGTDSTAADALSTVFYILGDDADGKWKRYYDRTVFSPR